MYDEGSFRVLGQSKIRLLDGTMEADAAGAPAVAADGLPALVRIALGTVPGGDIGLHGVLDALQAAIYMTDSDGRITYFNEAAATLWGCRPQLGSTTWCGSWKLFWPDGTPMPHDGCAMAVALKENRPVRGVEGVIERPDGTRVPFVPFPTPLHDAFGNVVGAVNLLVDIAERKFAEEALRKQARRLEALNRIGKAISSGLELDRILQTVTDSATDLSGAQFGAFFYNAVGDRGEHYALHTLSGAPRSAFETFGLPGNTEVFEPTFRGTGIVRSDDIRSDPRYGKNAPHGGMPTGHLPVVSYLAVPVISRTGEVHGGLFFGHDQPAVFTPEAEEIVAAIAAQAALAIDNARLLQAARVEVDQRARAEQATQRLAAIVESSDDAILTKDLNGIITSWNRGAQRIFGYTADEMIGKPVITLIPLERRAEETEILARIRRGERVDHYETIRQHKDGSAVEISLTVSPLKNSRREVIGASKIARDIIERRRAQEKQQLLIREMDHRVKNLFALAGSIVTLSARSANTPQDLARDARDRLGALARAHALTLSYPGAGDIRADQPTTVHALVRTIVSPYDGGGDGARVVIDGPDIPIGASSLTSFALFLHEFATNAAKYGALSTALGRIDVACCVEGDRFILTWKELGGPPSDDPSADGFGTFLARATVERQLGGEISRDSSSEGIRIRVSVPRDRLIG